MHPVKPLVFVLCLLPMVYCVYQVIALSLGHSHRLGADPGEAIVHFTGQWALRLLLLTLCVTPLQRFLSWPRRVRRMLGLFCFFYALVHAVSYTTFLLGLRFTDLGGEILERPYITVGFAALITLLPLAVTSNRWMIRRLKRRWQTLHRLVYVTLVLALVHLVWQTRADYTEAAVYGIAGIALMSYRILAVNRWFRSVRRESR